MKRSAIAVLFALVFTAAGFGQTAVPSPAKTPPPAEDGEVVKISTTLIKLDATVTDGRGRVIRDLRPEEFEVFQNGKQQRIASVTFVSNSLDGANQADEARPDPLAARTPPPVVRPANVRRTLALVVDDLALNFHSAYHVRRALRKFVDEEMRDGDLVAIIRTGAGIGALQQFTSDKRILYAAIERVKWNPRGRAGISTFEAIQPTGPEIAAALGDTTVTAEDIEMDRRFSASADDLRRSTLASATLGALQYIVDGMGELPGRKSVVLFSEGFSMLTGDPRGFLGTSYREVEGVVRLVDTANRASVVFYTIDPRGLEYTGPTAADKFLTSDPRQFGSVYSQRSDILFTSQTGTDYLAKQTGGLSFVNNNDLSSAVRDVMNDQSYYLISYEPDSDTFDPKNVKYNDIKINVTRNGTQVRYRSGFVNVAEESLAESGSLNRTPVQQIQHALISPFGVNDISLSLNSLYGNEPAMGNYVQSLVHISAKDLKFIDGPNGTKQADISVLAMSFGDNGYPVDRISKDFTLNANQRIYEMILREGFVYHFAFPVKKPGAYQYRVALRDKNAGTVGSASQFIEVPDMKKDGHVISGIVLQGYTTEQWKQATTAVSAQPIAGLSSPMNDTALRRFTTGGVLQYSFEIYNPRTSGGAKPNLATKLRVFRDGKLVLDGDVLALDLNGQADLERIRSTGAITLARDMGPGDYILQVIVFDNAAKEKRRMATQFVQFELLAN